MGWKIFPAELIPRIGKGEWIRTSVWPIMLQLAWLGLAWYSQLVSSPRDGSRFDGFQIDATSWKAGKFFFYVCPERGNGGEREWGVGEGG